MAKRTTRASSSTSQTDTVTIHDQQLHRGAGGELRQIAEDGHDVRVFVTHG
ncbi:hypothetical protein [Rhizobium sp. BE258]|uniref:hypothetical protein n=1 Tax=Rhizobium sp. BE258 TaxID=2817722 RepID=UPI00285EBA67|nr:hypothetical protein [Rhizobium sp. BE258]MDR7141863.1 hypothetical protein [Rhizobium sp. BE258]